MVIALDASENRSRISQAESTDSGNAGPGRGNVQKYQNEKNVCFLSIVLLAKSVFALVVIIF